ncbi:hypothetical protein EsH8_II_000513 [Colletotrichum jinshuiense]
MKPFAFVTPFVACINAHAIFQKLAVNGADKGELTGIRAPESTDPIQDVADPNFACNNNIVYRDNTIIAVPAGASVGAWWGHTIGGPLDDDPYDPDHPIAESHKGPIMVYLAKVNDAANADSKNLEWFKIAENGLNDGVWAVDDLIADGGWYNFTMPSCVPHGEYLMRVELLALHGAYAYGEAQFYMECAQIRVEGYGTGEPSDLVAFPGTYSPNDPGILINIYDDYGSPNNRGQPYQIPGPRVISCSE